MTKPLDRTGTYRTYSMADGLAGMRIEHIADDSEGCVWFATYENGVSRFDEDEFQNFTKIEAFTTVLNHRGSQKFIGHSAALRQFQFNLEKVASTDMTVLILGETGVGKGLAARTLHALSANSDGPFIEISCGALPGTLIDSELFGHERGAFTGAVFQRLGRVELAEGGTLFLDEIGDSVKILAFNQHYLNRIIRIFGLDHTCIKKQPEYQALKEYGAIAA